MSSSPTPPPGSPDAARVRHHGGGRDLPAALTTALDRTADFVVAGFASWTVIAHLSFLADWDRDPTTALWIATLPVVLALVLFGGRTGPMRLRSHPISKFSDVDILLRERNFYIGIPKSLINRETKIAGYRYDFFYVFQKAAQFEVE